MQGASLVVEALLKADVKHIFALSGNQIMPIFDACIDANIEIYHVRHEAAATYMADAYAQLTGGLGVALVTAAPGFANALSPLYSARLAESPILLLSGDSSRAEDGRNAFQSLNQVSVSSPFTKFSYRSDGVDTILEEIAKCARIAKSGRPGPVHLALPFDNLTSEVTAPIEVSRSDFEPHRMEPPSEILETIKKYLRQAVNPIILTGPMLTSSRTGNLLNQLSGALNAPVISMESPRGIKDPALGTFATKLAKSDVVLSIGKRLDFTLGNGQPPVFSTTTKFIIADPDPEELVLAQQLLGKRLKAKFVADSFLLAEALCRSKTASDRSSWRKEVNSAVTARPKVNKLSGTIHPADVGMVIQDVINDAIDPILIVDGGEFGQWAQATINAPTRIINGPSGAIGGSICYAFAAKIARPNATVIVLMGDGTIGFHFSEFESASRYGKNFIAIVGNDARWNAEYQIQLRDYGSDRLYGCELKPTSYNQAAEGFGCYGAVIENTSELRVELKKALAGKLPACMNVMIEGVPAP